MKSARRHTYTMVARADGMAATRDRIVHTMLRLALEQPSEDITLVAIAQAADVSHQTVLNHFDSKEGVAAAATDLLAGQTGEARAQARHGDVRGAIRVLVGEYERIGDANVRWALSAERLGSLAPRLDEARVGHQAWLEHIFGDSLPETAAARRQALHALHVSTDAYAWKLLRRDLRLSRTETEAVIVDLVNGTLHSGAASRRARSTPESSMNARRYLFALVGIRREAPSICAKAGGFCRAWKPRTAARASTSRARTPASCPTRPSNIG